ncbi:MAG: IPT/TIG domain-containing protein [Planctomycetota bacterium]
MNLDCASGATRGTRSLRVTDSSGRIAYLTAAVRVVDPAPTITQVAPTALSSAGGEFFSILGTGFTAETAVVIGGQLANQVQFVSSTQLSCTTPPPRACSHPGGRGRDPRRRARGPQRRRGDLHRPAGPDLRRPRGRPLERRDPAHRARHRLRPRRHVAVGGNPATVLSAGSDAVVFMALRGSPAAQTSWSPWGTPRGPSPAA